MKKAYLGAALLLLVSTSALAAQIEPATLSYQGILTDNTGAPLTGVKTLRICLYQSSTGSPDLPINGGSAFWCDTFNTDVRGGRFSVILGTDSNPLKSRFDNFKGETYIGIKVGADQEMPQRQKLTSVAYAIQAASVTSTDSIIPPGSVMVFAGSVAPQGWLFCDGSAVSRTTYARLYAAIGTAHGRGDGNTTFHLPDYRGRFLRGVDGTAGRDPDSASRTAMGTNGNAGNTVGSVQGGQFSSHNHGGGNHSHGIYDPEHSHTTRTFGGGGPSGNYGVLLNQNSGGWIDIGGAALRSPTGISVNPSGPVVSNEGGGETRPVNAYVHYIIKY